DLLRELVAVLERTRPHPAGQPCPLALLHQLEQVGLPALLHELAGVLFHRATPRVGLHAPPASAGAARAVHHHHHVTDLPRPSPPSPRLAVEDQAAADAGPPEDTE